MKQQSTFVSTNGKTELSSSEQELLKGAIGTLRVSSERIEEIVAQTKVRNPQTRKGN